MHFKNSLIFGMSFFAMTMCTNGKTRFIDQRMGFFITSVGFSDAAGLATGGDFGGIEGADEKCRTLAFAAGEFSHKTWRAYLSYNLGGGVGIFSNARDRIGQGPWYNAAGEVFSPGIEALHTTPPAAQLFLTEKGETIPGNEYIATGSDADGILQFNCSNYGTTNSGSLMSFGLPSGRWNYERDVNCDPLAFQSWGIKGRFYCFAAD